MKKTASKSPEKERSQKSAQVSRVLIPLVGDDIAPRFDLAQEALIIAVEPQGRVSVEKSIILSHASAEALCRLIMTEKVDTVVCCAIEEEYYQYLTWKKVKVIESVMGPSSRILERLAKGPVSNGENLLGH